jgi:hypothetical protein
MTWRPTTTRTGSPSDSVGYRREDERGFRLSEKREANHERTHRRHHRRCHQRRGGGQRTPHAAWRRRKRRKRRRGRANGVRIETTTTSYWWPSATNLPKRAVSQTLLILLLLLSILPAVPFLDLFGPGSVFETDSGEYLGEVVPSSLSFVFLRSVEFQ